MSDEVRMCHAHAEECAHKAKTASSEAMRGDFLRLKQNWLNLARSYDLIDRITDFQQSNRQKISGAKLRRA
jgi:hypothetical protein